MEATHAHVVLVNRGRGHRTYDELEPLPGGVTPGEVYRAYRSEYGRCTGHVYVDGPGGARKVGWVFLKRVRYSDCADTYLQEAWVTLTRAEAPARVTAVALSGY